MSERLAPIGGWHGSSTAPPDPSGGLASARQAVF
jgi:hypothetical protein